jgi:hypothetical protein
MKIIENHLHAIQVSIGMINRRNVFVRTHVRKIQRHREVQMILVRKIPMQQDVRPRNQYLN